MNPKISLEKLHLSGYKHVDGIGVALAIQKLLRKMQTPKSVSKITYKMTTNKWNKLIKATQVLSIWHLQHLTLGVL